MLMTQMDPKWVDAHFCSLHSQTNVYALTKILMSDGPNKLLVAPIRGQVVAMEYQRIHEKLNPSSRAIQFTYIPGDAEIVSLDAFAKSQHGAGLTVGITFLKLQENESRPLKQFLNIYSFWQQGTEFNLDSFATGCVMLELDFVPYQLTHTELVCEKGKETVFLLSGTDNKVHMYKEDRQQNTFVEYPSLEHFPEFGDLSSSILWMDILYVSSIRRVTGFGTESGLVVVSLINVSSKVVEKSWSVQLDSPITTVKFFSQDTSLSCPAFIDTDNISSSQSTDEDDGDDERNPQLNLLVTSALEVATVYRDVLSNGLNCFLILPDSNKFDSVMCACAMDVDFDGQNEIILGTYGQELLVYKYHPPNPMSKPGPLLGHQSTGSNTQASSVTPKASRLSSELSSGSDQCTDSDQSSKLRHRSCETKTESAVENVQAQRRAKSQEDLTSRSRLTQGSGAPTPKDCKGFPCGEEEVLSRGHHHYKLLWKRSFAYPVLALDHADIMGDGLEDLAVVTLKGLHILQPDLEKVAKLCLQRLRTVADTSEDSDDAYKILQSENLDHEDWSGDRA
ncbi:KICSTOR complex protein kaptin-like isoform X2 [Liolophura sinensis]|uniref:KICSTOR complex protein kaptin-like isoform X2 n=1 Tax=Liolophura sinensis TaxID=3198878 RepID=UPI0031581F59